jgi:hypothetical protein
MLKVLEVKRLIAPWCVTENWQRFWGKPGILPKLPGYNGDLDYREYLNELN